MKFIFVSSFFSSLSAFLGHSHTLFFIFCHYRAYFFIWTCSHRHLTLQNYFKVRLRNNALPLFFHPSLCPSIHLSIQLTEVDAISGLLLGPCLLPSFPKAFLLSGSAACLVIHVRKPLLRPGMKNV